MKERSSTCIILIAICIYKFKKNSQKEVFFVCVCEVVQLLDLHSPHCNVCSNDSMPLVLHHIGWEQTYDTECFLHRVPPYLMLYVIIRVQSVLTPSS